MLSIIYLLKRPIYLRLTFTHSCPHMFLKKCIKCTIMGVMESLTQSILPQGEQRNKGQSATQCSSERTQFMYSSRLHLSPGCLQSCVVTCIILTGAVPCPTAAEGPVSKWVDTGAGYRTAGCSQLQAMDGGFEIISAIFWIFEIDVFSIVLLKFLTWALLREGEAEAAFYCCSCRGAGEMGTSRRSQRERDATRLQSKTT